MGPRQEFDLTMLTIVILTKNEAKRLPACLAAIPKRYPVTVLDSGSEDDTVVVAEKRGCTIYRQQWLGFSEQRNFALQNCNIKKGWVLFIDADEFYPLEFFAWFESKPALLEDVDVLMVPSWLVFCGHKLRYAPGYPIYHPRLVRAGVSPFTIGPAGHSETLMAGFRVGYSGISYSHHFFDGDISTWMTKHISLARMEISGDRQAGILTSRARMSLKLGRSFIRMPIRFLYHYLLKGGFFDGWRGLLYSLMYTWYEMTKYIMAQFQKRGKGCGL